jgi:threonine synthase
MSEVQYVSTRGEAPASGFAEVMLAGLARDGGLYVPQEWPRLEPQTIAAFAGRSYAEVAIEVIRPFVGEAIGEADLARMAREAYGSSARTPSCLSFFMVRRSRLRIWPCSFWRGSWTTCL